MTEQEKEIIEKLCEAHNIFCKLPIQHLDDASEWTRNIHNLQRIIMSRMAVREVEGFINIDDVKLHRS